METQIESFWVLALASKCSTFSSQNTLLIIVLICVIWFSISLLYWAHPGGPAWGRYRYKNRAQKKTTSSNTPNAIIPGPRGFAVIGSFNLMANPAHRRLATAADRFGAKRLMAYSLGETRVIVTCNPDVAKEILNSSVFADRPVKESAYSLMFNRAIGFAPYGVYWRTLRRIAATHLFSPKQISASEGQRYGIASQMVSEISRRMSTGLRNDDGFCVVRDVLKRASLHNMMGSVFGREYELGSASNAESDELGQLVDEGYELLGKLNWSDHLPWLGSLDLQRIRFRCSQLVPRVNRFVTRIIQEHRTKSLGTKTTHDFVDVLLSLHGPDKLSDHDMIAVLWEMIFRGTDTVAVLIEWILARMVLHPDVQSKVQDELDQVVGRSRPLTQSDIPSLVYLPAVVKEVLRLHPPGPLLSWARLAIMDTVVDGYHVPAGTTAMVNMWAITRDPRVWSDPLEFDPERFATRREADVDFSVMGSDLRLAPFGSGRRTCPGKALGLTTVIFWVGALLHEFKWVGSDHDPVDLSEVLRLSCEMAKPLAVKVCPRRIA
ncbi:Cytochrome P450, E-class, group I [Parasponia andersonii]|uniref:Cytochrome P450, E-class, group I n=1 Tax=Parasponia andersonii TaxID=3476 RepID=A0A2P5DJS6_PARAD|nr:Cytochrome P450, E-class, group I [Parasponia andersonii]